MNSEINIDQVIEALSKASILKGNSDDLKKNILNYIGGSKGGGGGGGKKGGGSQKPTEQPDNLFSESCISITDLLCEGPIEGVYIPSGASNWSTNDQLLRSTYLNQVPIINDNNTINYFSYNSFLSNGSQDSSQGIIARVINIQQPIKYSLQTSVVPPEGGASKLLVAGISHSVLSPYVNRLIIGLRVPTLYSINTSNGNTSGATISFAVIVDGVNIYQGSITGKTTTGYVKQFVINLPPASQAVEATLAPRICIVQKTNPDSTAASLAESLILDYIVEIGTDALIYPNSAMVRSKFSSRYFSTTPNRQYDLLGLQVLVPSNYYPTSNDPVDDPIYGGKYYYDWDGNFAVAQWTNNPAWCLYDLLTNTRYGLGNYIDSSLIDKWALYQIGRYCDELVPITYADGTIGTEPRFTCNVKIDSRDDAFKIILQFTSLFRGLCFWDGSTLSFSQDSPKDAIMQFNNSNVTSEGFSYTDIDKNSIYSVALVGYYDKNDYFQKHVVYVQNPDGVIQYGIREIEIDAFGCTSRTQAYRLGKWALYSSLYEKEIVTFKTGLDILYCKPGDVIQIMDSDRLQDRRGGRIQQVINGNNIILDQAIYLDPNQPASLSVIVPKDIVANQGFTPSGGRESQIQIQSIVNITGTGYYQQIELDSALQFINPTSPIYDNYVWILDTNAADPTKNYYTNQGSFYSFASGYLNQQSSYLQQIDINGFTPSEYRILSIKENGEGVYEVTALQYNPDKYALIEEDNSIDLNIIQPPTQNGGLVSVGPLSTVISVDSTGTSSITVSWETPVGFSPTSMSYVISYTYQSVTTTNIIKVPFFVVENITVPNATVSIVVYPIYDNNPGQVPSPNVISTANVTNTNNSLANFAINNFEIVGQGTNYENVEQDISIDWSINNTEVINLINNFQLNVYNISGHLLRSVSVPTISSNPSLFSYDYTYSGNSSDGSGIPYRNVNFAVNAISVYSTVVASATLDTTNSAPRAVYPGSGFVVTNVSNGFRIDMNSTGNDIPLDYNGFLVYYSTGYFTPSTAININTYSPNSSQIQMHNINGLTSSTDTVNIPAGSPYYACVVAYDTFGLYNLNLPTGVFSGTSTYGVASGSPSTPNGFSMSSIIEKDINGNNQSYIFMSWNTNPETNIDGYDIRLAVTGLNTRYYAATESQTNLYVPFSPGLNVTGTIRAVNTQGNYSAFATGTVTTPTFAQHSVLSSNINLTSGQSQFSIVFPTGFNYIPNVVGSLQSSNPTQIISSILSGISTTGFHLILSTGITNTGYNFQYFAA